MRAEAVLDLLSGKANPALRKFSRVAELAPRNGLVWSDLAAVRLQRGRAFSDPYEFILALGAANRAFRLDPGLRAGRFNRALALQRLGLYDHAREEWRLYLESEREPGWILEAQTHVAELKRQNSPPTLEEHYVAFEMAVAKGDLRRAQEMVARTPQVFRERAEETFLAAWADARVRGDEAEAHRQWTMARIVGEELAAKSGERMISDSLAHIERVRQRRPAAVQELAKAIRSYGRGVSFARRGDFALALPFLQTARKELTRLRSPLAEWAICWTAVCHYQHSQYEQALKTIRPLIQDRLRDRYPALHARALALVGVIRIIQGDPTASGIAYQTALSDFRRLGESGNMARTAALQALNLEYLGRRDDAWRQLYPALLDSENRENPAARQLVNVTAAWLSLQEGEKEIALWFQDELVHNALDLRMPQGIVEALRGRSEILVALGERARAEIDLEQAKRRLADVTDPASREILEGDLRLAEAKLADSPQEALDLLDDVVRIFRSSEYHYRLAQALHVRATTLDGLGRSAEAERDLAAAIGESERQRERIDLLEQRISYFDQTREVLDAMVQLQMERRRRPAAAFAYSERARARVLLDWLLAQPSGLIVPVPQGQTEPTGDPARLWRGLPTGTSVLEYWILPRKLVIWVLRRDGFQVESVTVDRQTLEGLVHRLSDELVRGRRASFLSTSSELYDLLIRPVSRHLRLGERLIAVPDGALHGLPFAVLRDRRSAKFLIEKHIFSVAPSVRVLLASLSRDTKLRTPESPPRALLIVDPAFDPQLFPTLARVRSSWEEEAIARNFRGSRVLKDRAATKRAFLEASSRFEIVHFGGHSLVNSEYPLLSRMVFAADPEDPNDGVLYSGEILRQRFSRTRLAVLASCSTAMGKLSRTEGIESLARPFLATGVPAVVASLWDVDDELTAQLFSRFYGHLAESFDPAAALHQTQIESLASPNADPRVWAAFELIGASASPR